MEQNHQKLRLQYLVISKEFALEFPSNKFVTVAALFCSTHSTFLLAKSRYGYQLSKWTRLPLIYDPDANKYIMLIYVLKTYSISISLTEISDTNR